MGILLIVSLAALIAFFWYFGRCYRRESAVTAVYKHYGVYGRLSAWIPCSCLLGSFSLALAGILSLTLPDGSILNLLFSLAGAVVCFLLFRLTYRPIKARCPQALQKKLLSSMFVTCFGVAIKIALFFLPMIWALSLRDVVGSDGRKYIVWGRDLLDEYGNIVGTCDAHGNARLNSY